MKPTISILFFVLLLPGLPHSAHAAPDRTLGMALMSAAVRSDGTLVGGAGAVSSSTHNTLPYEYEVVFNRNLSGCDAVATPGALFIQNTDWSGFIAISALASKPNSVLVLTKATNGTPSPRPFHLIIFCAE